MSQFAVTYMTDNSRTRRIGYQVISRSAVGGLRVHAQKQGKPVRIKEEDSAGLIAAKAAMEEEAAKLNLEADANRARANEAHAKFLADRAERGL